MIFPQFFTGNADSKKTIVLIGGSGMLGRAFVEAATPDVFFVNVSRKNRLDGNNVQNILFDLTGDIHSLFQLLEKKITRVDVLINMAYSKSFSSVKHFDRHTFLGEIDINVAVPVLTSIECAERFWSKSSLEENKAKHRKAIQVSSLAGFGKTARPELATYSASKSALNSITPYLHDFLFSNYGVSAHVIAPGSLHKTDVMQTTVSKLWKLIRSPEDAYSVTKI